MGTVEELVEWAITYALSSYCHEDNVFCLEETTKTCPIANIAKKYDEKYRYEKLYRDGKFVVISCVFSAEKIAKGILEDYKKIIPNKEKI